MCVCVAVFFVISPLISELMSFSSLSPITPSLEDSVWENNTYPHPLTYIYSHKEHNVSAGVLLDKIWLSNILFLVQSEAWD